MNGVNLLAVLYQHLFSDFNDYTEVTYNYLVFWEISRHSRILGKMETYSHLVQTKTLHTHIHKHKTRVDICTETDIEIKRE